MSSLVIVASGFDPGSDREGVVQKIIIKRRAIAAASRRVPVTRLRLVQRA